MAVRILDANGNPLTSTANALDVNIKSGVGLPVSGTVAVSNFPATQPVSGSVAVSNLPATQPVSAAALPLPSGAATSAKQPALGTAGTPSADVVSVQGVAGGTPQPVSGTVAVSNFPVTQPVSGTVGVNNFPATQPVSAAALPLPTGAATAAKQPALGTAGSPSTDVVSVQGVAGGTPQPVSGSVAVTNFPATQPVSGTVGVNNFPATQPVSAAALPLPTGASTAAKQPALGTAGTPSTDVISVQGVAGGIATPVSGSVAVSNFPATQPVSGTVALAAGSAVVGHVIVDSAPTTPVTGTFFQATQPVSAAALPLPTGAATSANQPTPTAKGAQGANATPTQDLKDAGRTYVTFTALAAAGVIAEALLSFSQNKQGAVTGAVTSYVVPSGKTLRLTSISVSLKSAAAAIAFARLVIRHNTAGAVVVGSPAVFIVPEINTNSATSGTSAWVTIPLPDGIEIFGNGTQAIGISHLDQATTNILNVTLTGFEY